MSREEVYAKLDRLPYEDDFRARVKSILQAIPFDRAETDYDFVERYRSFSVEFRQCDLRVCVHITNDVRDFTGEVFDPEGENSETAKGDQQMRP